MKTIEAETILMNIFGLEGIKNMIEEAAEKYKQDSEKERAITSKMNRRQRREYYKNKK